MFSGVVHAAKAMIVDDLHDIYRNIGIWDNCTSVKNKCLFLSRKKIKKGRKNSVQIQYLLVDCRQITNHGCPFFLPIRFACDAFVFPSGSPDNLVGS